MSKKFQTNNLGMFLLILGIIGDFLSHIVIFFLGLPQDKILIHAYANMFALILIVVGLLMIRRKR